MLRKMHGVSSELARRYRLPQDQRFSMDAPRLGGLRVAALVTGLVLGTSAWQKPAKVPDVKLVESARVGMGSNVMLTAVAEEDTAVSGAFDEVFAEFERLDALMSVWREESD